VSGLGQGARAIKTTSARPLSHGSLGLRVGPGRELRRDDAIGELIELWIDHAA